MDYEVFFSHATAAAAWFCVAAWVWGGFYRLWWRVIMGGEVVKGPSRPS